MQHPWPKVIEIVPTSTACITVHAKCTLDVYIYMYIPVSHPGHCQGTLFFLSLRTSGGTGTHPSWYQILHWSQQTIHLPPSGILQLQWTSTLTLEIVLSVMSLSVLENGFSCLALMQLWRWLLIPFCTYFLETGSTPAHKSYAIAIAYKPQSLPPSCRPTFIILMVKLGSGVCKMLHAWEIIVSPSSGTIWRESKSSRVPEDENLLDRQAQWPVDTCTICTNPSESEIHTPFCFNIHVSRSPFCDGNWDRSRKLAADICVAVSHLPSTSTCSSAMDKPRLSTHDVYSGLSGTGLEDKLIVLWQSSVVTKFKS